MVLSIGQSIADRYRLVRRIAVGGMGEVWEAADARLDRRVAVKVLKPELSGDPEFLRRFEFEARTTASLNHPGIASVYDYGETATVPGGPDDTAYLVMELVDGEPLTATIARRGRLTADHTLDVLAQASEALQAAHQRGLVHRDVKPANIMITPAGRVKLTDFGIAKAVDAAPVTKTGMVMGTAHYIAPEQAMGQDAEPASDVYSLGVVGYECLAGRRPFVSDNPVTVAMMHIRDTPPPLPPDVPARVRELVDTALVKDPRARYRNGGQFAAAVAAVRAGRPLPRPNGAGTATAVAAAGGAATRAMTGDGRPYTPTTVAAGPPTPVAPAPAFTTHPPVAAPPRAGRRTGPWIVVGMLLVVALALLTWLAFTFLGGERGQPSTPIVTQSQTPTTTSARATPTTSAPPRTTTAARTTTTTPPPTTTTTTTTTTTATTTTTTTVTGP